jgi:predicted CXXCH cytochrome family protein
MLGHAHLRPPRSAWSIDEAGEQVAIDWIDASSDHCLSCHDGAIAGDAGGGRRSPTTGFVGPGALGIGVSHPVSIPHDAFSARGQFMALRPRASLDPRLRLFDGAVECATCHSPYAGDGHLLTMPNQRSELCLSCHDP